MKWNSIIIILTIMSSSCGQSALVTPSLTTEPTYTSEPTNAPDWTPTVLSTPNNTPSFTKTVYPSPTVTITSELTATLTSFPTPPGLFTRRELQDRINDWVSGKIEFNDEDRLLDEKTGKVLRLGLLSYELKMAVFIFYNLGFTEIPDEDGVPYLVNAVGFEDPYGQRFTSLFHNGSLLEEEALIQLRKFQGRTINRNVNISSERLIPMEFVVEAVVLPKRVFTGINFTDDSMGNEATNKYLVASKELDEALVDFFLCKDCSIEEIPVTIQSIINTVPEQIDQSMPYLPIYTVNYW